MKNMNYIDVDIARSRFLRSGGVGDRTNFPEKFKSTIINNFYDKGILSKEQNIIILSYNDESDWTIITENELISKFQETNMRIKLRKILSAEWPKLSSNSKLNNDVLEITDIDGAKHIIRAEPGKPLSGIWNILKWVETKNSHRM